MFNYCRLRQKLTPAHQPAGAPCGTSRRTVLTSAQLVAIMLRPGSRMSFRPDAVTRSRTVSMRSFGVGSLSPLLIHVHIVMATSGHACRANARDRRLQCE